MKTENIKKTSMQSLLSKLVIAIGILLMVFMITTESEPGALPLFLILVGTIWFFITKFRLRSQSRTQ